MCHLLFSLHQSVVSLFLCKWGPEHILISRFHISALPAAPSLVVQPWLSVCCSVSEYTCEKSCTQTFAHLACAAEMWVLALLCTVLCWSCKSRWWSVLCCLLLVLKVTVWIEQSHVGHQHSSGASVNELISRLVSITSALSPLFLVLSLPPSLPPSLRIFSACLNVWW